MRKTDVLERHAITRLDRDGSLERCNGFRRKVLGKVADAEHDEGLRIAGRALENLLANRPRSRRV